MKSDKKLTSVKIHPLLLEEFNQYCQQTGFSIQKLTERSMFLYMTDPNFKDIIYNQIDTHYTGSSNGK